MTRQKFSMLSISLSAFCCLNFMADNNASSAFAANDKASDVDPAWFKVDDWTDADTFNNSAKSAKSSPVVSPPASDNKVSGDGLNADDWPMPFPISFLKPSSTSALEKHAPLKVEVSESVSNLQRQIQALTHAPSEKVYETANQALADGNYELATPLYQMLTVRSPKESRYFYGAGLSLKESGNEEQAFPNLLMAWHLGDSPVYEEVANQVVSDMKKRYDGTFKLSFQWNRTDPETPLNAGTRLWKLGMTAQAVQLFEYVLKNEPLYRGIAAYDLGAIAEHNGDFKVAAHYYQWALKQQSALDAYALKNPDLSAQISKMQDLCPKAYMAQALSDVQNELKAGTSRWNGWTQGTNYPTYWASEVCPLCAISRTTLEYKAGQVDLR